MEETHIQTISKTLKQLNASLHNKETRAQAGEAIHRYIYTIFLDDALIQSHPEDIQALWDLYVALIYKNIKVLFIDFRNIRDLLEAVTVEKILALKKINPIIALQIFYRAMETTKTVEEMHAFEKALDLPVGITREIKWHLTKADTKPKIFVFSMQHGQIMPRCWVEDILFNFFVSRDISVAMKIALIQWIGMENMTDRQRLLLARNLSFGYPKEYATETMFSLINLSPQMLYEHETGNETLFEELLYDGYYDVIEKIRETHYFDLNSSKLYLKYDNLYSAYFDTYQNNTGGGLTFLAQALEHSPKKLASIDIGNLASLCTNWDENSQTWQIPVVCMLLDHMEKHQEIDWSKWLNRTIRYEDYYDDDDKLITTLYDLLIYYHPGPAIIQRFVALGARSAKQAKSAK
jgi:hypothetical protein